MTTSENTGMFSPINQLIISAGPKLGRVGILWVRGHVTNVARTTSSSLSSQFHKFQWSKIGAGFERLSK